MKSDIVKKLESMKDVTKETYDRVVDSVALAYIKVGDKKEVSNLSKQLKKHWKSISNKSV